MTIEAVRVAGAPLAPTTRPPGTPRTHGPGGPRPLARCAWGALVGVLVLVALVLTLRLQTGFPVGVSDNADGARLYCAARLAPDTPEGTAAWRGVVVTTFRTDGPGCVDASDPPSSATLLLHVAVALAGPGPLWSLRWLALLLAGLVALGAGVAAWASAVVSYRRSAVALLPLLPLVVVTWWSRFFVSTYSESAGLLGAVWFLLGLGVLAATTWWHRWPRVAGLGLVAAGGIVAGTAKPGYVVVALAAAAVAALVVVRGAPGDRRSVRAAWRSAGPVAGLLIVVLTAGPAAAAVQWQHALYARVNTHDLVFQVVLPELGTEATTALGLPPSMVEHSGEGFYVTQGRSIPGWDASFGTDPDRVRGAALGLLVRHPEIALDAVGTGLSATLRPQLPYLTSAARGTVPDFSIDPHPHPDSPQNAGPLLDYLGGLPGARLPLVIVLLCTVCALATRVSGVRRRLGPPATLLVRTAAASALAGVALVAAAVLGDGFYELTKHVWLASYLLAVGGLMLVAAGVVVLDQARRRRFRRCETPVLTRAGSSDA